MMLNNMFIHIESGDILSKKTFILIWGLTVCIFLKGVTIHADELPRLSSECQENMKQRDSDYNGAVMRDIIESLDLEIDEQNYYEVTDKDLYAANLIYGGREVDEYYQSLHKQFIVASRGKPTLYIKPSEAYVLYKQPDNINIAVHLKLTDVKWKVIERKKEKGNPVSYKLLKCEKDYLKAKNNYLNQQ